MANYPTMYRHGTLVHTPELTGGDMAQDPTIRSRADGGYVKSRTGFTRTPRRWHVAYTWLTQANKNTLRSFESARGVGGEAFLWTNPEDGVLYTVRLLAPLQYTPVQYTNFKFWDVEFDLEQV